MKWISVKKKLPVVVAKNSVRKQYIVKLSHGTVCTMFCNIPKHSSCERINFPPAVTHWMPLPKPPKKGE